VNVERTPPTPDSDASRTRLSPLGVLIDAGVIHYGADAEEDLANDALDALNDAGYVVVPREHLALILSRYLQGDTSRDAASDAALHALYVDLDTTAKGSHDG
jgi:hypothetical protein